MPQCHKKVKKQQQNTHTQENIEPSPETHNDTLNHIELTFKHGFGVETDKHNADAAFLTEHVCIKGGVPNRHAAAVLIGRHVQCVGEWGKFRGKMKETF